MRCYSLFDAVSNMLFSCSRFANETFKIDIDIEIDIYINLVHWHLTLGGNDEVDVNVMNLMRATWSNM